MKTKVLGLLAMFMFAVITVFAADKTEKIQVKASDTCKDKIEQAAKQWTEFHKPNGTTTINN